MIQLCALLLAAVPSGLVQEDSTPSASAPRATRPADLEARDLRSSTVEYDIRARLEDIDEKPKRLVGSETIRWTNRSGEPVGDLWFHLYLNAFANNRSAHMSEAGGSLRGKSTEEIAKENWWGWQQIESVKVGGVDVTDTLRYRTPDAKPGDLQGYLAVQDHTVVSVDLPRSIADREEVEIEVEWSSRLPRVRRRTGYKDDFLLVAQWFPKLGVYEGGRGWNCHQFHASTEFYADYGYYKVSLDLPARYSEKVYGSGVRIQDMIKGDDRVQVVFEAPSLADRTRLDQFGLPARVHDFTWTGDTKYQVHTKKFSWNEWADVRFPDEVAKARAAFGEDANLALRDVDITVLIQPEHVDQAERHALATEAALFFYGLWFGEYPYEHITVIDPAWGARGAGGMEYPTLFTAGTRMYTRPSMHSPESVTVHEAGHQFWYGLVGNNEFEAAWLDEGFNSYTDSEVLWRVFGPEVDTTDYARVPLDGVRPTALPGSGGSRIERALTAQDLRLPRPDWVDEWKLTKNAWGYVVSPVQNVIGRPLRSSGVVDLWRDQPWLTLVDRRYDTRWSDRYGYLRSPDDDPIETYCWKYVDGNSHRTNSYPRTAVALRTLRGLVGEEAFLRGMRAYAADWRYRHPYPQDFYASFLEHSGADVAWFLEDAFQTVKTIDWSVEVDESKAKEPVGWFLNDAGQWEKRREADAEETAEAPEEPEAPQVLELTLRRKGELCMPLLVRVQYEFEGDVENAPPAADLVQEFTWSREEQLARPWMKWERELPKDWRTKSVILDPERKIYMDLDMSDNQWFRRPNGRDGKAAALHWTERVLRFTQSQLVWQSAIGG
ncbi:MAG: M1 family metallopeptidase [Planctomycetes bacterium]|nr:M1 family metallopeptidase [Planctomycetota bacterium]MCB9905016.1 M1 family metallopeptidase [Planctomycetota bacterium]